MVSVAEFSTCVRVPGWMVGVRAAYLPLITPLPQALYGQVHEIYAYIFPISLVAVIGCRDLVILVILIY
jgi:hypothetical protein